MSETLFIKKLYEGSVAPTKGSKEAAGYDLYAYLEGTTDIVKPFSNLLVSTGVAMKIPHGYYGRIAPRSGFSVKTGLVVNAGVIDSDYRGEVKILFQNPTDKFLHINHGEKVAQIIIEKIAHCQVVQVEDLDSTERGSDGFGSTGTGLESTGYLG
jgi:dUTP pyrophosphatase